MEIEEIDGKVSIYKAARKIKRRDSSLYNALMSIYHDSTFVGEISQLWPQLPLLANLRCGLWYSSRFDSTCYFKSTDGHTNNCSFSTSRLNLHVSQIAGQKGGCIIVDSTRKGKRFPDSMSKTIPIWTCVLNRAILNYRNQKHDKNASETDPTTCNASEARLCDWDCSLHLPLWVSATERADIEDRLEGWTKQLESCGADIASVASSLKKPLRPLWISQKTVIWLNEVPDVDCWDFTPIILVSASSTIGITQNTSISVFSWSYIPGAGDDEESWSRGLSPRPFWKHAYDLISSGPDLCNQKVAYLIEKDRIYRTEWGKIAPQVTITHLSYVQPSSSLGNDDADNCEMSWLGSTNIALGTQHATSMPDVDCILNCDQESLCFPNNVVYLHLPMNSKLDRFSLLRNLPYAVDFAKLNLGKGKKLLVCCHDGEDISVCVCLAILTSLFDGEGTFDDGKYFSMTQVTKWEMRRRLVFLCKFATSARPSRGNLRQVFNCLSGGRNVYTSPEKPSPFQA